MTNSFASTDFYKVRRTQGLLSINLPLESFRETWCLIWALRAEQGGDKGDKVHTGKHVTQVLGQDSPCGEEHLT